MAGSLLSSQADTTADERLAVLMRDLSGWKAEPVSIKHDNYVETVNGPAVTAVLATRHYIRGKAGLDVEFFSGAGTPAPSMPKEQTITTSGGLARAGKIGGFATLLTASRGETQTGRIESQLLVWLSASKKDAKVLAFTGEDLNADELLSTAAKLDWRAFAAADAP